MSDHPEPEALLAAAVAARQRADDVLMARFRDGGSALRTWEKAPGALVTDADMASDAAIADSLRASGMGGRILSEETPTDLGGGSGVEWLVDPLCGTVPYSTGMVHWGVNVAARVGGRLVAATFSTPAVGESVQVVDGRRAKAEDGEALGQVGDGGTVLRLADATIGLEVDRKDEWARLINSGELGWVARVGQVNAFASAAYPLMQVCRGRLAGVVFYRIEPMHVAAGVMAAMSVGAKATDATGADIDWSSDEEIGVLVVGWAGVREGVV